MSKSGKGKAGRKSRAKSVGYYIPAKVWEPFAKKVGIGPNGPYTPRALEHFLEAVAASEGDVSILRIANAISGRDGAGWSVVTFERELWDAFSDAAENTCRNPVAYLSQIMRNIVDLAKHDIDEANAKMLTAVDVIQSDDDAPGGEAVAA
jgi:hypothetical protein